MLQPLMVGMFLVLWIFGGGAPSEPASQAKITRARAILRLAIDGKYAEFAATGTDQVKAAMDAGKAKEVWTALTTQYGAYQAEDSVEAKPAGGFWAVNITCRFERSKVTLMVALDDADQMAGFRITKVEPLVPYKAPDYVQADSYREEAVTVSAGEFPLPGTLSIPKAAGPHAGVVLVHGSGPHDQDETVGGAKPFRDLAGGLASRGIVVLRYEKRTHKHPMAVKPDAWTLDNETIDDAIAAAKLLGKRPEVDARRVFIVGHSLGAFAAPFIAERDPKLGGIVMLAGNARPILDVIDEQVEYLAGVNNAGNDYAKAQVNGIKAATAALRQGKTDGITVFGAPGAYFARLNRLDAVGTAAKLKLPVLILQGGRDYQVTTADFAIWKQKLGDRKNVTLKLYPKLNHLFESGEGRSTPAEYQQAGHVDQQVIEDIAAWLGRH